MSQELLNSTIQAIVSNTTKCTKHLNKAHDPAHNYHSNHHGSSSSLHDGMIVCVENVILINFILIILNIR